MHWPNVICKKSVVYFWTDICNPYLSAKYPFTTPWIIASRRPKSFHSWWKTDQDHGAHLSLDFAWTIDGWRTRTEEVMNGQGKIPKWQGLGRRWRKEGSFRGPTDQEIWSERSWTNIANAARLQITSDFHTSRGCWYLLQCPNCYWYR